MKTLTKSDFEKMSAREQGYWSYMQAAWNKNIPDENPYESGTIEYIDWNRGRLSACIDAQDGEE